MASDDQAYGVNAVAEFLKNFVAAKQAGRAQKQEETKMQQQLAMELMKQKAEQQAQEFSAYSKMQDDIRTTLGMGARTDMFDPTGKLTGSMSAKLDPQAVKDREAALLQGFRTQYPNSRFLAEGGTKPPPSYIAPTPVYDDQSNAPRAPQALPGIVPSQPQALLGATAPKPLPTGFGSPLAVNTQTKNPGGGGDGSGTNNKYLETLDTALAKEDSDQIINAAGVSSDIALLTGFAKDLEAGKYYTGFGAGQTASILQPELEKNLGRTKNIAVAQYGKSYKGAMSEIEFKTMIEGAVNPTNVDKKVLAANIRDLAEVRRIGIETATNRSKFVAAGGRPVDFKIPDISSIISRIEERMKAGAVTPAPSASPGGVVAAYERGPDGKMRKVK